MVQKSAYIIPPVCLITTQFFFLKRKRVRPGTIFIISKKSLSIRLERRNWMIRGKKIRSGFPAHKSILDQGQQSILFPDAAGLHRLGNPISVIKLFYSVKVCVFDHANGIDFQFFTCLIGDFYFPDLPYVINRNENSTLCPDAVKFGDYTGIAKTDMELVEIILIQRGDKK